MHNKVAKLYLIVMPPPRYHPASNQLITEFQVVDCLPIHFTAGKITTMRFYKYILTKHFHNKRAISYGIIKTNLFIFVFPFLMKWQNKTCSSTLCFINSLLYLRVCNQLILQCKNFLLEDLSDDFVSHLVIRDMCTVL